MNQGNGPIQVIDKLWGREWVLVNNGNYCAKKLYLQPGYTSSLHYHKVKRETFVVERGECWLGTITIDMASRQSVQVEKHLFHGDWVELAPGVRHRFWNNGLYECVILEVSTTHREDDVYRISESRELREDER